MLRDHITSNGIHPQYPFIEIPASQSFERMSLANDGTIDPSWLERPNPNHYPQQSLPSISPYSPGDSHCQRPTPISTTAEVWMGYSGDEASVSGTSPISPIMANRSSTCIFMEACVCGCDKGVCFPQREYDRPRTDPLSQEELEETILFSVNGVCGYPLKDALKKQYTGLDLRDAKMFINCKSSISIRLEWLPYEKWTRQIRTLTWKKEQDHITLAKLATEVAKRMKAFFEEMETKEADPSYREYRVQPGVIDLEHMELVALKRVSKSSWMPHLRRIAPPY